MRPLVLRGPVLAGGRCAPGAVVVRDGRVAAATPAEAGAAEALPPGWVIAPGPVDLHVNGYGGAEVGDDPEALVAVARALARDGVAGFCPTLVSRPPAAYRRAARAFAAVRWPADGARPLGVHLEGPFLSPRRAGAHRPSALRPPSGDLLAELVGLFRPRIVTLAPELPGALEAVRALRRAGVVVALGHTEADAAVARAAIDAGARLVTHALNAMPGVTARGPGVLAAALLDPRVRVAVIADGVHVAPEPLALLARLAGTRLVLVSDAAPPAGAPPGPGLLGGRRVVSDGDRVVDEAGRLAGAARSLPDGIATLAGAGVAPLRAVAAACVTPRRVLGVPAAPVPGAPADLAVLDGDGRVRLAMIGGRVVAGALPGSP